jgi:hypothetical protein
MRSGLLIALTLFLLLPIAVSAQSFGGLGDISGSPFSISASPQYPAPYSQATVSILPGSVNITNSTMTASVDGKEIYKGAARPFSVPLGKTGSVSNVKVTISSNGSNYSQTISIQPQDVVLIAEPISSAPPLYPGKSLVPIDGSVRVVAMADLRDASGKTYNPSSDSYTWVVDDTRIANSSGIGKSSIIVASPLQYRSRSVSVAVTNSAGSLVGGASLSLSAEQPSLRVYEYDPLLGLRYDHSLSGGYNIGATEATLYAAPFSMSTTGGRPSIEWFLNGTSVQTGNIITLRPTGSGQGTASLSLTSTSGNSTSATMNLSIIFGAKPSANFFGL